MNLDRARRIQVTINTPGWADIVEELEAIRLEAFEKLEHMMDKTPEKLTGKSAVGLAARRRGLKEFRESIEDSIKLLTPNREAGN